MDVSLIRFLDILRVLSRHEADFIVVGGAAAILEGAPISTLDLDILMLRLEAVIQSKEEANREKDQAVLPVLRRTLELRQ